TGKLHWIWHKATEVFPVYSKDGFNDLIGCDIIIAQEDDDDPDKTQYVRQAFRLEDEVGECWYEEVLFNEELEVKRVIQPKMYLGFDFVPVVIFNVNRSEEHTSELQSRFDLVCRLRLDKKT